VIAGLIGGAVFIGSVMLMIPLKKGVQPEGNPNYYYVNIEGPPGATLQDMRGVVDKVDALIARQPETQDVFRPGGRRQHILGTWQFQRQRRRRPKAPWSPCSSRIATTRWPIFATACGPCCARSPTRG